MVLLLQWPSHPEISCVFANSILTRLFKETPIRF
jgi:hypothetical protein